MTGLIRKELLAIETDPFSPERGQLGFLQALVQRITFETIGGAIGAGATLPPHAFCRRAPASTRTRSPR